MRFLCSGCYALFLALLILIGQSSPSAAQNAPEKAALCASCHGQDGIPLDPTIPVIWGQNEGYLYIQLRDFARGARKNDQMAAVVQQLSKEEMQALAAYFSKQPWPNLSQKAPPQEIGKKAEAIANSAQCPQCHLGGYLGAGVQPRLAGQSQTYLRKTMMDFRSGARANNDWMTALLKTYSDADIAALAAYLAGF